jgi:hypothetical protein
MSDSEESSQRKLCWLCSRPIAPARLEALREHNVHFVDDDASPAAD